MPSSISSGIPEMRVDTTGTPMAMASASTFGMPSRSPSVVTRGASTNTSARAIAASASVCGTAPASVTRSPRPRLSRSSSSSARSGPSP